MAIGANWGEIWDETVWGAVWSQAAVSDTTPPVISLNDSAIKSLGIGDAYVAPSVTAFDDFDGDITFNIVVGGDTVDTSMAGTYIVTYDVDDAAGNSATQVVQTINVSSVGGSSGGASGRDYLPIVDIIVDL